MFLLSVLFPKKQPKVSREQVLANLRKRVQRGEDELNRRKTALEAARKNAEEKQQMVMEQATVVSDLKNQHAELRGDIANNPTPDASEDVGPAPTQQVPPLNPAGDDMDADLCEEMNPPAWCH